MKKLSLAVGSIILAVAFTLTAVILVSHPEKEKVKKWCSENNITFHKIVETKPAYNYPWNDTVYIDENKCCCEYYEEASKCYRYDDAETAGMYSALASSISDKLDRWAKDMDGQTVIGKLVLADVSNAFHSHEYAVFLIPNGKNQKAVFLGTRFNYSQNRIGIQSSHMELYKGKEDEILEKCYWYEEFTSDRQVVCSVNCEDKIVSADDIELL